MSTNSTRAFSQSAQDWNWGEMKVEVISSNDLSVTENILDIDAVVVNTASGPGSGSASAVAVAVNDSNIDHYGDELDIDVIASGVQAFAYGLKSSGVKLLGDTDKLSNIDVSAVITAYDPS